MDNCASNSEKKNKTLQRILILGALLVALLLKLWLVLIDVLPFNSDEAIVALMARHILEGARPIFFYGQAYMGSLDAWLVAIGFWIFGQEVWVIRLVQGLLYLGVLLTTYWVGEFVFGSKKSGITTIWLLAVPNVIVTLYTTVSLGGYGEALLLGNLILILGFHISASFRQQQEVKIWQLGIWGFMVGLGVWVFGITLVYSIPMGISLLIQLWHQMKKNKNPLDTGKAWLGVLFLVLGGILGAIPWWLYAYQNGFKELISELMGSAVAVEQAGYLLKAGQHLISLILFGTTAVFGMRPSWEIRWLGLPLLPLAFAFWVGVLIFMFFWFKREKNKSPVAWVLVGMILVLSLGFIFTSFGVDPSGRYFVPLVIPISLFAGEMIHFFASRYNRWVYTLVGFVMVFNFWGITQSAYHNPPGITTQFVQFTQVDQRKIGDLIEFLEGHGETRGYTNYWVSYPLAFLTSEECLYVPRLPYHSDFDYTDRDDRYEPYGLEVNAASKVAYITTLNPNLDGFLRDKFTDLDLTWNEKKIGDFQVFYNLSEVITPEEIGLGLEIP